MEKNKKSRRDPAPDLALSPYGKLPPQAKELETYVLGAILMEKDAIDRAMEILKPECFYVEVNQWIFHAMVSLHQKGMSIDTPTVAEHLGNAQQLEQIGGQYYLHTLTNSVVSSANLEQHCRIILEKFMKRELIRISGETIGAAYDGFDVFEIMDDFEKQFTALSIDAIHKKAVGIDVAMVNRYGRIMKLKNQERHITGIPSGFYSLDKITHGWQRTDLIILAARPGVGKTALALNLARNAALNKIEPVPVAFFSLEMSEGQLTDRLLSSESEIWLDKLMNGTMTDDNMRQLYTDGVQKLAKAKIFIDDSPALNIYDLRSRSRQLKRKQGIGLIIIDYLQLMRGTGERRSGNREQEISEISRELKALAKELDTPIIALSQLSRKPEDRKGDLKMPQLSDLRESGAIEQDADLVLFLYRPEYYDQHHNELGESIQGETHLSISKNRHGKLAKGPEAIKLRADLSIQKFYDATNSSPVLPYLGPGNWKSVNEKEKDDDKLPF